MQSTCEAQSFDGPDLFAVRLAEDGQVLERAALEILQLNVGKLCNMACHHCHVEAGPKRTEVMSWETMRRILDWVDVHRRDLPLRTVDLTGGAPEMNPHFRRFVRELKARDLHVLDRCNLTILTDDGFEDLPDFLARHEVEIVASLPCYLEENVDKQRGRGTFKRSIEALRRLNAVGYGQPGSALRLDLVYNPVGYGLPPGQAQLEADYKEQLGSRFGIVFDHLWTITNMPIERFAGKLRRDGRYDGYFDQLTAAHNPAVVEQVMCRYQVSVDWQGDVYDCDFNQMLLLPLGDLPEAGQNGTDLAADKLWDLAPRDVVGRKIRTGSHCFGCTAGAGSSCTGALG